MDKSMKKSIFLVSCLLAGSSFATSLSTYEAIKDAVEAGHQIRIGVDFARCTGSDNPLGMRKAFYTPNEIVTNVDYVSASLTHYTLNDPAFPGQPVYQFAGYKFYPDNALVMTVQVLAAANHVPMAEKVIMRCALGAGVTVYTTE
jgi:hypothetical protein